MKHKFTIQSCGWLLAMLLATTLPASAQVPWANLPGAPNFDGYRTTNNIDLSAPAVDALWGIYGIVGFRSYATRLYRTLDNGQSWNYADVAEYYISSGIYYGTEVADFSAIDAQTAWLLITNGTGATQTSMLRRTTTGPAGLSLATTLPINACRLHFFNATTGICIAQPATGSTNWIVYRTTDAGITWTNVATTLLATTVGGQPEKLPAKAAIGLSLWLGTETGNILKTDDGGLTWSLTPTSLSNGVGGIVFRNALHGLAYGYHSRSSSAGSQRLVRTTDGGLTWQLLPTLWPVPLYSLAVQLGTNVYVGVSPFQSSSLPSLLATSTNEGDSWQIQSADNVPYNQLSMSPTGQLWAATSATFPASPYGMLLRYTGNLLTSQPSSANTPQVAYPNPTSSLVKLTAAPGETICVYDATGRLQAPRATAGGLDFSTEPAGIYFITITSLAGTITTQRLSVVH